MLSDEEIAKITVPELLELVRRLLDEIELRAMQDARQFKGTNGSTK